MTKKSKSNKKTFRKNIQQKDFSDQKKKVLIDYYNRGNLKELLIKIKDELKIHKNNPFLFHMLGSVLSDLGKHDEAMKSFQNAIKMDPKNPDIHCTIGNFLHKLNQFDNAIYHYKESIKIQPGNDLFYNNLGKTLMAIEEYDTAKKAVKKALEINPLNSLAHNNMGIILHKQSQSEESIKYFQKAIEINPSFAEAFYNLAVALHTCGHSKLAIQSYEKAIRIRPNHPESHINLATILNDVGEKKQAILNIHKAIELNPDNSKYYRYLSRLEKIDENSELLIKLKEIYKTSKDLDQKINTCFALANIKEKNKDFNEAFFYYDEGNHLRKEQLSYDRNDSQKEISIIKNIFEKQGRSNFVMLPQTEKSVILIVGMPRSGTSVTEQILASHSKVYGADELEELGRLGRRHFLRVFNQPTFSLSTACRQISKDYDRFLKNMKIPEPVVTDKMPANFRWVGFLLKVRPDIKIVNLQRDPRAVTWSIFKQYFPHAGLAYAFDLIDIVDYYHLYRELMDFWHELFPGQIYDLSYERLTENQAEETRKLLEYCGLEWEDQCLEFHKTKRTVKTASAAQVRNQMYRGSSDDWRQYENHLEPMLNRLKEYGYI